MQRRFSDSFHFTQNGRKKTHFFSEENNKNGSHIDEAYTTECKQCHISIYVLHIVISAAVTDCYTHIMWSCTLLFSFFYCYSLVMKNRLQSFGFIGNFFFVQLAFLSFECAPSVYICHTDLLCDNKNCNLNRFFFIVMCSCVVLVCRHRQRRCAAIENRARWANIHLFLALTSIYFFWCCIFCLLWQ